MVNASAPASPRRVPARLFHIVSNRASAQVARLCYNRISPIGSVLSIQGPQSAQASAAFAFPLMRTIIYVDGFNLYYRMLATRPALKWLNVKRLAENLLRSENVIVAAKYYTARVSGRIDSTAPARQQIYLDALATVPEISVYMGNFLTSEKFAGMVKPPKFRPPLALPPPWPDVVKVIKTEEKCSDVNLLVTCC
jgi:hypothetical protein